jgi:uncharacterized RDD family membrane protein YckC
MRRTIEQLTVKKTFYNRYTDAFGNRQRDPYKKEVPRKVNVVTSWTRFAHYFVDAIVIGIITFVVSLLLHNVGIHLRETFSLNIGRFHMGFSFENYLIIVLYYFGFESAMQSTPGKLITNSVVINEYAAKPDSTSLIGRSFSRIVPFEIFSCLSDRGWHDKWSRTYVVTRDEHQVLQRLMQEQAGVISDSEDLLD